MIVFRYSVTLGSRLPLESLMVLNAPSMPSHPKALKKSPTFFLYSLALAISRVLIYCRFDASKIKSIISQTDTTSIEKALKTRGLVLDDVTFETQNDEVGPADIVMLVSNGVSKTKIGLSVKYANTCTLNVTGRNFITDNQISQLKSQLPVYTQKYIHEMVKKYGDVGNWFRMRKPSETTDAFIDLIRDAVIANWKNVRNKTTLLSALFHSDSPIEFGLLVKTGAETPPK